MGLVFARKYLEDAPRASIFALYRLHQGIFALLFWALCSRFFLQTMDTSVHKNSAQQGRHRHRTVLWLCCIVLCCPLFTACGSWRISQLWEKGDEAPQGKQLSLGRAVDSSCPLPQNTLIAPVIPPTLQEKSSPSAGGQEPTLPYTVAFTAPKLPEALPLLQKKSLLTRLKDTPPADRLGLDFRITKDTAEAESIMQSLGYYSASVTTTVDSDQEPVQVTMELDPGPLYTVANTPISYTQSPPPEKAPASLTDLGLPAKAPARAESVLDSVDSVSQWLKEHGYPLARVESSRFFVNKDSHTLDAEITVAHGPKARMGRVIVEGSDSINPDFINRLRPWREGSVWNEKRIENFRNELAQQGLFRSIALAPRPRADDSAATPDGPATDTQVDVQPLYDVLLSVADAPQRTIGGGLNYESDRGLGGQAFWEHRNLLGSGEKLRAEMSLWQDRQNARLNFTKPAFLQRGQSFTAETWLRSEDTDAYYQQAAWAGAGIERRLSRYWWASVKASAEGGELRDPMHPRKGYSMFGLPLGLRYDNTNNLLDSTKGLRAKLGVTPYEGWYGAAFSLLLTRLDASAYLPLKADDSIVLAARASTGSIWRDDAMTVPASVRFYSGGGGSVRGYAYQSLGPRDHNNDPLGGASFLEMSVETRIKITKDFGIVPFLDGGNAYADKTPRPDKDGMQWGAGLGFRYYTSIGPLRLDVATPLNPRKDDAPYFVYISIGQSF